MRDAFVLLVLLGGVALLVLALVRVTNRRRATDDGFVAERPLTPELRASLRAEVPTATLTAPGQSQDDGEREAPPVAMAPLVDLLSGMELPCELEYLGAVVPEAGVREVLAFFTTTHPADEVATAMAAELARLGYTVAGSDVGWVTVATRDDIGLHVEVHPEPETVLRKTKPAFPTAPTGGVVLEITRS